MKRIAALLLVLCLVVGLAACGGQTATDPTLAPDAGNEGGSENQNNENQNNDNQGGGEATPAPDNGNQGGEEPQGGSDAAETVSLTLWVGDNYPAITQKMVDSFKAEYEEDFGVTFDIQIGIESESTCKDTVLADPEAAADVYTFADDQLFELVNAGALEPLGDYSEDVRAANGGTADTLASVNGTLYAFPMNVSNGYFLYYNKEYLTEEDVQSLDRILEVAAENGKFFAFDMANAWYTYSFFQGAGLDVISNDGVTNESCDWNATDTTPTGVEVYEGLLAICGHPGFKALGDADTVSAIKDGSVIAAVNGVWNSAAVQEAWGENYACAKLPTFTAGGNQYQMGSFTGGKLVGVNAHSKNVVYALLLADWLTNEENQLLRFQELGDGPSNLKLADNPDVASDPAIVALAAQAPYANKQVVGGNYWSPAATLGQNAIDGVADDIQGLLDTCVAGILG